MSPKYHKICAREAFTLLEMMVSISIIVTITAIFLANFRTTNKRTDLTMAAQNLAADLHMAQNNTLGLVKYNGEVPPGGWGVSFNTSGNGNQSYTIFADLDAPGESGYKSYDPDTEGDPDYGARTTVLSPGIVIESLKTDSGLTTSRANATFLPPDPQTNIIDLDHFYNANFLEIKLKELQNNSTKTIRVNFLGLIEVLD